MQEHLEWLLITKLGSWIFKKLIAIMSIHLAGTDFTQPEKHSECHRWRLKIGIIWFIVWPTTTICFKHITSNVHFHCFSLISLYLLYLSSYRYYWKASPVRPSCDADCKKRLLCDLKSGRSNDRKLTCQEIEERIDSTKKSSSWKTWLFNGFAISSVFTFLGGFGWLGGSVGSLFWKPSVFESSLFSKQFQNFKFTSFYALHSGSALYNFSGAGIFFKSSFQAAWTTQKLYPSL